MATKTTNAVTPRNIPKRLGVWALVIAAVLMIPLATNAPWTGSDFVFGAVVLFILATVYELVTRNMSDYKHRAAVGAAVLLVIALIIGWAATGP
jgi:hypothetical protein